MLEIQVVYKYKIAIGCFAGGEESTFFEALCRNRSLLLPDLGCEAQFS